jgi:hypothetical protein
MQPQLSLICSSPLHLATRLLPLTFQPTRAQIPHGDPFPTSTPAMPSLHHAIPPRSLQAASSMVDPGNGLRACRSQTGGDQEEPDCRPPQQHCTGSHPDSGNGPRACRSDGDSTVGDKRQVAKRRRLAMRCKREAVIATKHPTLTIQSTFPDHIQARYCYRPRHNTSLIDAQVFSLLRKHALLPLAPRSSLPARISSSHLLIRMLARPGPHTGLSRRPTCSPVTMWTASWKPLPEP